MISDLESLWRATQSELPPGFELAGIVYHGPDHPAPWIAFAEHSFGDDGETCEGVGTSPAEAIDALTQHIASEHP